MSFYACIRQRELDRVRQLFALDMSPNCLSPYKVLPLHQALLSTNDDACQRLHLALHAGRMPVVIMALNKAGARWDACDACC